MCKLWSIVNLSLLSSIDINIYLIKFNFHNIFCLCISIFQISFHIISLFNSFWYIYFYIYFYTQIVIQFIDKSNNIFHQLVGFVIFVFFFFKFLTKRALLWHTNIYIYTSIIWVIFWFGTVCFSERSNAMGRTVWDGCVRFGCACAKILSIQLMLCKCHFYFREVKKQFNDFLNMVFLHSLMVKWMSYDLKLNSSCYNITPSVECLYQITLLLPLFLLLFFGKSNLIFQLAHSCGYTYAVQLALQVASEREISNWFRLNANSFYLLIPYAVGYIYWLQS